MTSSRRQDSILPWIFFNFKNFSFFKLILNFSCLSSVIQLSLPGIRFRDLCWCSDCSPQARRQWRLPRQQLLLPLKLPSLLPRSASADLNRTPLLPSQVKSVGLGVASHHWLQAGFQAVTEEHTGEVNISYFIFAFLHQIPLFSINRERGRISFNNFWRVSGHAVSGAKYVFSLQWISMSKGKGTFWMNCKEKEAKLS